MNKRVKNILIIIGSILLFFIVISAFSCMLLDAMIYEHEQRFKPSGKVYKDYEELNQEYLYVVTKDDYNDEINYYKVNKKLKLSESNKFDYEENNILRLSGCFESYVNHDKNKVLNKLTMNTCKVLDNNDNEMRYTDDILDIIKHISKLEHQMIRSDIIVLGNEYYVIVSLNVNWWTPYSLYKYENNKLKKILTLDGENIIAMKKV